MKNISISLADWQKGYIAGMIDGEGCVHYYKSKAPTSKIGYTFVAKVTITNSHFETLFCIQQMSGLGKIYQRTKQRGNRKIAYNLDFSPREAKVLLETVYPYLVTKKQQAKLMIEFCNTLKWGRGLGNILTQKELVYRHELFDVMKNLNRRGINLVES